MNAFFKGFVSMFDWMFPRTVDEQLQDLYDDMHWGMYKNPLEESKVNNWVVIDDEKIRHIWQCPVCDECTKVYPEDHEDFGGPICDECDVDMGYVYTEINTGGG